MVDGAKMPESTHLPAELGNFAYLNAAEVATGRDFRNHMERLIGAIEHVVTGKSGGAVSRSDRVPAAKCVGPTRLSNVLRYFAVPLILLLVAHHLIINVLDLRIEYL